MKSSEKQMNLVNRYLSGQATPGEVEALEVLMLNDPQLRADFLACARIDAALPSAIGEKGRVIDFQPQSRISRRWFQHSLATAAAIVLLAALGLGAWWTNSKSARASQIVAEFGDLSGCRWVDSKLSVESGDAISNGQRIELSAGSAELIFHTGARLELVGPAIIETRSDNGVFLTLGAVNLVADTPESKGFVVETPSSTFVDISTAFSAAVSPDGLSRLEVSEGEVDVVVEGIEDTPRIQAGQALYVEPGEQKIITRIESGDGTAGFHFPTIAPPSDEDFADRAQRQVSIRVVKGKLRREPGPGGPAEVLLDGKGQTKQDAPGQSAFFWDDGGWGSLLIDLGQTISITKINTYSWHQHHLDRAHRHRATQRYTLYGFSGDKMPDLTKPLHETGWQRIARVNSDSFFDVSNPLERPSQQACSITAKGDIGRYRYLLWVTKKSTFFGEFDVFGTISEGSQKLEKVTTN